MDFYLLNILISFFAVMLYASFRSGVYSYLRLNKNSKTFIKKSMKGFRNFWLYGNLKQELGYVYQLNLILLFGTAGYTLIALSLAWIDALRLPIAILYALLCVVQITAQIFSDISCNKKEFGTPIVIWRKSSYGRAKSSVGDLAVVIGLIVITACNFYLAVS